MADVPPPDSPPPDSPQTTTLTRVSKAILMAYFRLYHRYQVLGTEHLPPRPPLLALTNHVSLLDVPAFGLADRWPGSVLVGKASLMRVPIVSQVLRSWGVIPVDRDGRDAGALRDVLRCLREGRLVAVAAEGTRNRAGGLGEVNPVLARLAITTDAPLIAVVAIGTYQALPPGAWFPRPVPIRVRIGPMFDLRYLRARPRDEAIRLASAEIRDRLAALLPPGRGGRPAR